jgi:hypothetical protein
MKLTHWLILAIVVLALGNVILWNMLSGSEMSREAARSANTESEKQFQKDLSQRDGRILTLEHELADTVSKLRSKHASFLSEINRLNSKIVPVASLPKLPPECDTCLHQLVIRDEKITAQSGLIEGLQTEISVSEAKNAEIKDELFGKIELLDSANSAKFNKIDSLLSVPEPSTWQLGITGGIGTTLSDGKLHAGPTINFGLTKTIKIKKIRLRDLFRKKR